MMRRWLLRLTLGPILLLMAHLLTFRVVPVPLTPLMLIRLFEGQGLDHQWVPLDEMSPHLARSVIGSEDNHFCEHDGVDWSAVQEVLKEVADGDRPRGASTISMQTAKNLYLWPSRSVIRKGLEFGLVHLLEATWSKDRIIEVYLNIVELGPGIYGAEAAAQHYWGVTAASLSPDRAAALAAILPSPLTRDPRKSSMRKAVKRIQRRVRELGPLLDCVPGAAPVPAAAAEVGAASLPEPGGVEDAPLGEGDGMPVPIPLEASDEEAATPETPPRSKRKKRRRRRREAR